jgi:hypothetical protein
MFNAVQKSVQKLNPHRRKHHMESKKLHVLWANPDLETSLHMVMMYVTNSMANHYWDEVTVILWGATPKLAVENSHIQESMKVAAHVGVHFSACINCAERYNVTDALLALGVEVVPWGMPLTEILQSGSPLLTV